MIDIISYLNQRSIDFINFKQIGHEKEVLHKLHGMGLLCTREKNQVLIKIKCHKDECQAIRSYYKNPDDP